MIDTDVLEHIRHRHDSAVIYAALIERAGQGKVKTVSQVFSELEKHKEAYAQLKSHSKEFTIERPIQFCVSVQEKLDILQREASYLWPVTGGKNPDPADPWLVAVCAAHGFTLVTDESTNSPKKIPAACRHPAISAACISGPHFLVSTGIVTEIKPEHLSPSAFFGTVNA